MNNIFTNKKILSGLLIALFSLISFFSFGQTNKKTKRDEIGQNKEINRNYNRPKIKQKRDDYLSKTSEQRTGSGKVKVPTETNYIKNNAVSNNSSGDIKYKTKGQKDTEYILKSSGQRYKGDVKVVDRSLLQYGISESKGDIANRNLKKRKHKIRTNDKKNSDFQGDVKVVDRSLLQYGISESKGDIANRNLKKKKHEIRANDKKISDFQGDVKEIDLSRLHDDISKNQGDIAHKDLKKRKHEIRANDKKISDFQGNVKVVDVSLLQYEISESRGDIALRDVKKREKERRIRSKKIANFSGSIKTRDLQKWGKENRKKEKDIANFEGNIKLGKRKKGAHPSAAYKGEKVANSYSQKERMRKKMIKKSKRKGDIEKPAHLQDKKRKAKFNKEESEIWW